MTEQNVITDSTCPSCEGMRFYHSDHAPNGYEACSVCGGLGNVGKYRLYKHATTLVFASNDKDEVWKEIGKLPFGAIYEVRDMDGNVVDEFIPF